MKKKKKLKKKVRNTPQKKNIKQKKSIDRERIPYGPGFIEVVRKGKNIVITKKFTEEQQSELLKDIQENRPNLYNDTKELIRQTVDLINEYDKIFIIGGVAAYGLYQMMIDDAKDDGLSETILEYCQSAALATENTNRGNIPPGDVLNQIYQNIGNIRHNFGEYYQTEAITNRYSEIESRIRLDMILETMVVRGEGYLAHINELFHELFAPHDDFFKSHYGFISSDIINVFQDLEDAFCCRVLLPNGQPHPVLEEKLARWRYENRERLTQEEILNGSDINDFGKAYPEFIVENNDFILYSMRDNRTLDKLFRLRSLNEVQRKVVQCLSIAFGENKDFAGDSKYYYEILNESKIYLKPIIRQDGDYYLFGMNLGARNSFLIAQNLIKEADESYYTNTFLGNRTIKSKDEIMEKKVWQLFQKMLPGVAFYRNLHYQYCDSDRDLSCTKSADGNYELDILGISENATYIIEVKAGIVSNKAKRGAIESLKTDLREIIGNAVCQSHRAFLFIKNSPDVVFILPNKQEVRPLNMDNIFKISISFSFAGTILSGLIRLRELGVVEQEADFSWTINIYDLFAFSELIESETQFIDYLKKRIPLYQKESLAHNDEMDMLGFYFFDDLQIAKEHQKTEQLTLAYKAPIDNFFDHGGAKPVKRK